MNVTHQFAFVQVNKKAHITKVELDPPVNLSMEQLGVLFGTYCPQYYENEFQPQRLENKHCITSIIFFNNEEQNAVISWKAKPLEESEIESFYSTIPAPCIIGAMKSSKLQMKLLNAAMGA